MTTVAVDKTFEALLTKTCKVLSLSGSKDTHGHKNTWVVVKTGVKCYVSTTGKNFEGRVEHNAGVATHKVFMLPQETVDKNSLLEIDEKRYRVIGDPLNPGMMNHHYEVFVELVTA